VRPGHDDYPGDKGKVYPLSAISRFFRPYHRILFSLQRNRLSFGSDLLKKISGEISGLSPIPFKLTGIMEISVMTGIKIRK